MPPAFFLLIGEKFLSRVAMSSFLSDYIIDWADGASYLLSLWALAIFFGLDGACILPAVKMSEGLIAIKVWPGEPGKSLVVSLNF